MKQVLLLYLLMKVTKMGEWLCVSYFCISWFLWSGRKTGESEKSP